MSDVANGIEDIILTALGMAFLFAVLNWVSWGPAYGLAFAYIGGTILGRVTIVFLRGRKTKKS